MRLIRLDLLDRVLKKHSDARQWICDWPDEVNENQREMGVNALAKAIKMSHSALNDMLNGKRGWSKSAILKLSDYFKLDPAMFLRAK